MAQDKKDKLFLQLGKNDYEVGKQQVVVQKEAKKLKVLQDKSNEIATEIETLEQK